jgi:hypothetical protein
MRSLLGEGLVQLLVLAVVATAIGFFALVTAATFGAPLLAMQPEWTLGLVEGAVCPQGSELEFEAVRQSWHRPGEYTPNVSCVAADGSRLEGREARAIFAALGGAFLICFVPLFVPAALVSVFVVHKLMKEGRKAFGRRASGVVSG